MELLFGPNIPCLSAHQANSVHALSILCEMSHSRLDCKYMLKISKLLGPPNFDLDVGGTKHYLMHSLLTGLYPSFLHSFGKGGRLGLLRCIII